MRKIWLVCKNFNLSISEVLELNHSEFEFYFNGSFYIEQFLNKDKTKEITNEENLKTDNVYGKIDPNFDLHDPEVRKRIYKEVTSI